MKMILSNTRVLKMVKYGIVGVLGTLIHFTVLIIFVEFFFLGAVQSSSLGFVLVVIISYFLNKKWTFKTQGKKMAEFLRYLVVSSIGLLLNMLIMYVAVDSLKLDYLIGQTFVTLLIPIINYSLNNLWTFK